jgi:hypothetical protein
VTLTSKVVERHIEIFGHAPRQTAFDGGFASQANLADLKAKGVQDVVFSKPCGLAITEMAKSTWVFRMLRNFRTAIEGSISFLKRAFGMRRVLWRSFESFKSYVWARSLPRTSCCSRATAWPTSEPSSSSVARWPASTRGAGRVCPRTVLLPRRRHPSSRRGSRRASSAEKSRRPARHHGLARARRLRRSAF